MDDIIHPPHMVITINWFFVYARQRLLFSRQRIFFFRFIEVDPIQCRYFILSYCGGDTYMVACQFYTLLWLVFEFIFCIRPKRMLFLLLLFEWIGIFMFFVTEINMSYNIILFDDRVSFCWKLRYWISHKKKCIFELFLISIFILLV